MPQDQKNFLLAMALSLLVIVLWEIWFVPKIPENTPQNINAQAQKKQKPSADDLLSRPNLFGEEETILSPRIKIKTKRLVGSLQLVGSVLDDLALIDYRQTVEKSAPPVQFLKVNQFDAIFGWSSAVGEVINAKTKWKSKNKNLTQNKPLILTYNDKNTGLTFYREISIDENYMFRIQDKVINKSKVAQQLFPWGAIRRTQRPEISGFYLLHEGLIGFFTDSGLEEIDYDDLEDEPNMQFESKTGWFGFTDKYWAAILIPDQQHAFTARFARAEQQKKEIFTTHYSGDAIQLAPNQQYQTTQHFFVGAKETHLIDHYKTALPITRFDLMIDWGWFFFMTKPFFLVLDYFSKLTGNFGISILIVTVLVKLFFFPLVNRSYETMAAMRNMQPEIERIRARSKGDMMAQNREIAALWKKQNVKPLMGCLPMVLQIPVFFSLYKVLFVTIEMRHAPFFGWVADLSAPDPFSALNLFGLIPLPLPDFLIIGIWPLLMGLAMSVQMRLNPPPPDPIQRKVFAWAPVVITLLLAQFPVGLVIYATWNTLLSALQQGFIMQRQGVKINLFSNLGIKKWVKK